VLVGPYARWTEIAYCGRVELLCLRFHPHGASALLGIPIGEIANTIVEVRDVDPPLWREVRSACDPDLPLAQRVERLQNALLARIERARRDELAERAVDALRRSRGRMPIGRVARALGASARKLERHFGASVGLEPKRLARILRFQSAVQRAFEGHGATWVELAAQHGYSDQAHLAREFRELAGAAPTELLAARG
jgi:AraC-like DNA-binding protein